MSEPQGLPGVVPTVMPSTVEPTLAGSEDLSLRGRGEYARLSRRHAVAAWRRAFLWIARMFRSDDVASRVARAAIGAQRPVTTGKRIVVLGASGGTGTTTVAVALARTLSAVRNSSIALVATHPHDDIESRLDLPLIPAVPTDTPAATLADQMRVMRETGRLAAVRPHADVVTMARGLGRFFPVTVVDAGMSPPAQLLRDAHAIVVVASATPASTMDAVKTVAALAHEGIDSGTVTVALVPRRPSDQPGPRRQQLRARALLSVVIPHDRHLAGGAALHLRLAAENTQVAFGELAAAVMDSALR